MPYSFGVESKVNLMGVHPDLVKVSQRAIEISEQDFSVHDGLRTLVEQTKLFERGATKTLESKHLLQSDGYGHAVDLVPFINGKMRWEWRPIYFIAEAVHQACSELGVNLIWGGVWDREFRQLGSTRCLLEKEVRDYVSRRTSIGKKAFIDGPHFQLT